MSDIETKDLSFRNFLDDTWTRSLACRDWIYRFGAPSLSHRWDPRQLNGLQDLYDKIVGYLYSRVRLHSDHGSHPVEQVSFHQKFGWTLSSSSAKAYLGKVAISDDTPIQIGRQSYISGHALLRGWHLLQIGSFTAIAEGLYLNTSSDLHPTEYASMINFAAEDRCREDGLGMNISFGQLESQKTGIDIGCDVWIGRNVRVSHGARIAHGCVVGEQALVRGQTEPYGIYVGVPARLKRFRFSERTISSLLDIQWWNWPADRLLRNKLFFETNLRQFDGDLKDLISE